MEARYVRMGHNGYADVTPRASLTGDMGANRGPLLRWVKGSKSIGRATCLPIVDGRSERNPASRLGVRWVQAVPATVSETAMPLTRDGPKDGLLHLRNLLPVDHRIRVCPPKRSTLCGLSPPMPMQAGVRCVRYTSLPCNSWTGRVSDSSPLMNEQKPAPRQRGRAVSPIVKDVSRNLRMRPLTKRRAK